VPAARLTLALALATLVGCGGPEEPPPGLLLVTVDSLRADFLECYGGSPGVGERICELGRQGTQYSWAFATSPTSAAAIASILTSTYPDEHGIDDSAASFLPGDRLTLAEALRPAGYASAAFVSSPELNRSRNFHQGFQVYDDRTSRSTPGSLPVRDATETTDAALAWLAGTEGPWFVWVHYREPHGPYTSAPAPFPGPPVQQGPGERLSVLPTASGRGGIPSYQAIPGLFTREGYEARYRGEIVRVDRELGRLLDAVAARDEPVGVILTADHGEAFGEDRYYFSHGHSVGLDQIRVPLFWRSPADGSHSEVGREGGAAARPPMRVGVSTLDVMPTLLRAAGLGRPDWLEGWLLPSADDPPGAPEQARAIYAVHPAQVAVVSGSNFYTRLRRPVAAVAPELSPEYLQATAARTAVLSEEGNTLPAAEAARPTGITPLLEPRLADFLNRDRD
jgi:arylsulfatase A-like enzyme